MCGLDAGEPMNLHVADRRLTLTETAPSPLRRSPSHATACRYPDSKRGSRETEVRLVCFLRDRRACSASRLLHLRDLAGHASVDGRYALKRGARHPHGRPPHSCASRAGPLKASLAPIIRCVLVVQLAARSSRFTLSRHVEKDQPQMRRVVPLKRGNICDGAGALRDSRSPCGAQQSNGHPHQSHDDLGGRNLRLEPVYHQGGLEPTWSPSGLTLESRNPCAGLSHAGVSRTYPDRDRCNNRHVFYVWPRGHRESPACASRTLAFSPRTDGHQGVVSGRPNTSARRSGQRARRSRRWSPGSSPVKPLRFFVWSQPPRSAHLGFARGVQKLGRAVETVCLQEDRISAPHGPVRPSAIARLRRADSAPGRLPHGRSGDRSRGRRTRWDRSYAPGSLARTKRRRTRVGESRQRMGSRQPIRSIRSGHSPWPRPDQRSRSTLAARLGVIDHGLFLPSSLAKPGCARNTRWDTYSVTDVCVRPTVV
jgi:hypothetical protein